MLNYLIISCSPHKETCYKLIGNYDFNLIDKTKFNNCYLSDNSFGYMISNLELNDCGIEISDINSIPNKEDDFIITYNYPIKEILLNSESIENEGVGATSKKPIEIVLDKRVLTNKVFIYRLNKKNKYRLLLG